VIRRVRFRKTANSFSDEVFCNVPVLLTPVGSFPAACITEQLPRETIGNSYQYAFINTSARQHNTFARSTLYDLQLQQ
jgi:hypothetical protein